MEHIKADMRDKLESMSGYQVFSPDVFENGVQDDSIPKHPGWEDLITLEHIETRIDKLKDPGPGHPHHKKHAPAPSEMICP